MTKTTMTQRFLNLSTQDCFRFTFHCERCNRSVSSLSYAFNEEDFSKTLDKNAHAFLWITQHDKACQRASSEADFEFNICSVCGRRVCSHCFCPAPEGVAGRCLSCLERRIATERNAAITTNSKGTEGGEIHMLSSVTRRYQDMSTSESFAFVFYCDRCGREWRSDTYSFDRRGFTLPMDERIQEMLWNQQHDEAYERANREAGARFNRCSVCGSRVCDDCLYSAPSIASVLPAESSASVSSTTAASYTVSSDGSVSPGSEEHTATAVSLTHTPGAPSKSFERTHTSSSGLSRSTFSELPPAAVNGEGCCRSCECGATGKE